MITQSSGTLKGAGAINTLHFSTGQPVLLMVCSDPSRGKESLSAVLNLTTAHSRIQFQVLQNIPGLYF